MASGRGDNKKFVCMCASTCVASDPDLFDGRSWHLCENCGESRCHLECLAEKHYLRKGRYTCPHCSRSYALSQFWLYYLKELAKPEDKRGADPLHLLDCLRLVSSEVAVTRIAKIEEAETWCTIANTGEPPPDTTLHTPVSREEASRIFNEIIEEWLGDSYPATCSKCNIKSKVTQSPLLICEGHWQCTCVLCCKCAGLKAPPEGEWYCPTCASDFVESPTSTTHAPSRLTSGKSNTAAAAGGGVKAATASAHTGKATAGSASEGGNSKATVKSLPVSHASGSIERTTGTASTTTTNAVGVSASGVPAGRRGAVGKKGGGTAPGRVEADDSSSGSGNEGEGEGESESDESTFALTHSAVKAVAGGSSTSNANTRAAQAASGSTGTGTGSSGGVGTTARAPSPSVTQHQSTASTTGRDKVHGTKGTPLAPAIQAVLDYAAGSSSNQATNAKQSSRGPVGQASAVAPTLPAGVGLFSTPAAGTAAVGSGGESQAVAVPAPPIIIPLRCTPYPPATASNGSGSGITTDASVPSRSPTAAAATSNPSGYLYVIANEKITQPALMLHASGLQAIHACAPEQARAFKANVAIHMEAILNHLATIERLQLLQQQQLSLSGVADATATEVAACPGSSGSAAAAVGRGNGSGSGAGLIGSPPLGGGSGGRTNAIGSALAASPASPHAATAALASPAGKATAAAAGIIKYSHTPQHPGSGNNTNSEASRALVRPIGTVLPIDSLPTLHTYVIDGVPVRELTAAATEKLRQMMANLMQARPFATAATAAAPHTPAANTSTAAAAGRGGRGGGRWESGVKRGAPLAATHHEEASVSKRYKGAYDNAVRVAGGGWVGRTSLADATHCATSAREALDSGLESDGESGGADVGMSSSGSQAHTAAVRLASARSNDTHDVDATSQLPNPITMLNAAAATATAASATAVTAAADDTTTSVAPGDNHWILAPVAAPPPVSSTPPFTMYAGIPVSRVDILAAAEGKRRSVDGAAARLLAAGLGAPHTTRPNNQTGGTYAVGNGRIGGITYATPVEPRAQPAQPVLSGSGMHAVYASSLPTGLVEVSTTPQEAIAEAVEPHAATKIETPDEVARPLLTPAAFATPTIPSLKLTLGRTQPLAAVPAAIVTGRSTASSNSASTGAAATGTATPPLTLQLKFTDPRVNALLPRPIPVPKQA